MRSRRVTDRWNQLDQQAAAAVSLTDSKTVGKQEWGFYGPSQNTVCATHLIQPQLRKHKAKKIVETAFGHYLSKIIGHRQLYYIHTVFRYQFFRQATLPRNITSTDMFK